MRNKYFSIAIASLVLGILGATVARADALDDIKKKGTLVVGTKADYRPFGFLDPSGKIVGFEPDLAGRRGKASRRQAGTGASRCLQPHSVPAARQDRHHDRDDERHAGTPQDRRHRGPELLRLGHSTSCRRSRQASRPGKHCAARRCA